MNQGGPRRHQGDLAQPGVRQTMLRDSRGHALSGATAKSLPHYEAAVRQFSLFAGDPVATIGQAIAESPDFVMAHALRAWLHLLGTEPAGIPVARAALAMTGGLPATAQEKGHLAAIAHLLDGRWHAASAMLEDVTIALRARSRSGRPRCPVIMRCSACRRSASRRPAPMRRRSGSAAARSTSRR